MRRYLSLSHWTSSWTVEFSFYFAPVFVYCHLCIQSKMMSFCLISPVAIPSHSPCFWNNLLYPELKESRLWFSKDYFATPSFFKTHVCRFSFLLLSNFLVLYHCDQSPICRVGLGNPFPPHSSSPYLVSLGKTREMAFRFTVLAVSCNSLLFVLSDVQGKTNNYTNIIKGQNVPQWAWASK